MCPEGPASCPGGGGSRLLLGNEAIAQGLYEAGCQLAAAYPGTPSTEVLRFLADYGAPDLHVQWSINEKVALEVACAASYSGLRSAAIMKQVGLNVALDPLMSLAYTGVAGGMLVVVADDPGPHSSQTEQDTRQLAKAAGLPVLDPMTPEEAREMVHLGYTLSERYRIPVILRPLLRVCHSRAPIPPARARPPSRKARFEKDVNRWAATPVHRFTLHRELNAKLAQITSDGTVQATYRRLCGSTEGARLAVVASGTSAAYASDLLGAQGRDDRVTLVAVGVPFPLSTEAVLELTAGAERILVLEETSTVLEEALCGKGAVSGRRDGTVPSEGELTPDVVRGALERFIGLETVRWPAAVEKSHDGPAGSPPVLCAGCPHRASFWALKKAMPGAVYTGDIGCYTLGIALGAVDTVLCMGASISQAAGFTWAFRAAGGSATPVAAVIGDSTFYHAGIPALVNAVNQGASFVLLILDNAVTAMTGGQPTPGTGILADGGTGRAVRLEEIVRGCGVSRLWISDPLRGQEVRHALEEASAAAAAGEMAVVISRSPCVLELAERQGPVPEIDPELCSQCGVCLDAFGCPAMVDEGSGVRIIGELCPGCGACALVCPEGAIGRGEVP